MTLTRTIAVLVLVAGVGLAGCGSSTHLRSSTVHGGKTRSLVAPQKIKLVHWFTRLRTCLANDGLAPGAVTVTPRRLSVPIDPRVGASVLAGESLGCTAIVGGPPYGASLQALRGRLVLNLPG